MAEQVENPTMWLDELPDEVCETIAERVTHGRSNPDATPFAYSSRKQCRAVWNTVRHPVYVRFLVPTPECGHSIEDDHDTAEWALAFTEYEICLSFMELTPHAADVLRRSNVTECHIRTGDSDEWEDGYKPVEFDKPVNIVSEVLRKDSIKYLYYELSDHALDKNISLLFRQMTTMNLEAIDLHGEMESGDWLDELACGCRDISIQCPSLRMITTSELFIRRSSAYGTKQYHNETYWNAVEKLPTCCVIAIHSKPPDRLVGKLRKLRGLKVSFLDPHEVAVFAGPNVTFYDRKSGCLTSETLDPLKNCRNIRDLSLPVASEALPHVAEILRHCTLVRQLSLSEAVRVPKGALVDIARAAYQLEELIINDSLFSATEWKAALEVLGGRLKRLHLCLHKTNQFHVGDPEYESFDEQVDRLEAILRSILVHNRGLQVFCYGRITCPVALHEHGRERKDSIMALASRVQNAIPLLLWGSLQARIENIFVFNST